MPRHSLTSHNHPKTTNLATSSNSSPNIARPPPGPPPSSSNIVRRMKHVLPKTMKKSNVEHKETKCLARKPVQRKISMLNSSKQNKEKPAQKVWAKKVDVGDKCEKSENVEDIIDKVLKLEKR